MTKCYIEPDRNNQHNYMLDTSAYNHIAHSYERMDAVKRSLSLGFCYYSTALQDVELSGKGARTYNRECISVSDYVIPLELKQKFDEIDKELNVKLLPEIASGMLNHTRIDGTNRFLDSNSLEGKMLIAISNKNNQHSNRPFKHSYDAMIAEVAVHYGCVLVSDDKPLRDIINSFIAKGAISTDELVEVINEF